MTSPAIRALLIAVALFACPSPTHASFRENFPFYWINGGDLERKHDYVSAIVFFQKGLVFLQTLQRENPKFMAAQVSARLQDCRGKLSRLDPLARDQARHDNVTPADEVRKALAYEKDGAHENASEDYACALERLQFEAGDHPTAGQTERMEEYRSESIRLHRLWQESLGSQHGTVQ
jgi:hypothetical protein